MREKDRDTPKARSQTTAGQTDTRSSDSKRCTPSLTFWNYCWHDNYVYKRGGASLPFKSITWLWFYFLNIYFLFNNERVGVYECRYLQRSEEATRIQGSQVAGSGQPPDVVAGNQTGVLFQRGHILHRWAISQILMVILQCKKKQIKCPIPSSLSCVGVTGIHFCFKSKKAFFALIKDDTNSLIKDTVKNRQGWWPLIGFSHHPLQTLSVHLLKQLRCVSPGPATSESKVAFGSIDQGPHQFTAQTEVSTIRSL